MSPANYTPVGMTAATLVPVILWVTHWPIQPPTEAQAAALAALLIAAGGAIHAAVRAWTKAA